MPGCMDDARIVLLYNNKGYNVATICCFVATLIQVTLCDSMLWHRTKQTTGGKAEQHGRHGVSYNRLYCAW